LDKCLSCGGPSVYARRLCRSCYDRGIEGRGIWPPRIAVSDEERFLAQTRVSADISPHVTTNCILWTGWRNERGYGRCRFRGVKWVAHRAAWVLRNGEIPPGVEVCHKCDNPPCVNVEHLFLGTHRDNMHDMSQKGRCTPVFGGCHWKAKLNEEKVRRAFQLHHEGWTGRRIAAELGVGESAMSSVLSRKVWAHVQLESQLTRED